MTWGDGDIPALSARNVKKGFIDLQEQCYLGSDELYRKWMTNGDVQKNDIAFTMEAPLGNVALIPDSCRYILSQRTVLLQIDVNVGFSPFVLQVLLSDNFQRMLFENASGSTAQGIQRKRLEALPVTLPPLFEQYAIAAALSDMDELIAGLDRLIAKKSDLKQAAMQQLLSGETRLPGFSGEWRVWGFGELLEFRNGVNADKQAYGSGVRFINVLEVITNSHLRAEDIPGRVKVGHSAREEYRVRPGDIVFNRTSETPDEVGLASVYEDEEEALFGGFVIRGRIREGAPLTPSFAAYAMRCEDVRKQIIARGQGAIRANIGQAELTKVTIPVPEVAEQSAIAAVLSDMDAEITALEARRDKTRLLKQGMMQELLTGRTRLV